MKNGITLIVHREERDGHHSGYFQVYAQLTWEELEEYLSKYEVLNLDKDTWDRSYEFTVLVDGMAIRGDYTEGSMVPKYADDGGDAERFYLMYNEEWERSLADLDKVVFAAKLRADQIVKANKLEAERKEIGLQKIAEEQQKYKELKTLAELQAKYPNLK